MNKSNPLFVDSTKFHGDLIGTQIELRKILIYDDESLFVVVVNHQGQPKRMQMKCADERSYEVRVHLNHQTRVTYRFEIEKDGRVILQSQDYTGRAQYAIIEDWQPLDESLVVPIVTMVTSTQASPPPSVDQPTVPSSPPAPAWARESVANVRSLLDKFEL